MLRLATTIALIVACTTVLGGCGSKEAEVTPEPDRLRLAMTVGPGPETLGLYMALDRGYAGQAGLEVEVDPNADDALESVAGGASDMAIVHGPDVLLARDRGLDVTAVGALADRPYAAMLGGPDVRRAADVRGSAVTLVEGRFDEGLLAAAAREAGGRPEGTVAPSRIARSLRDGDADAAIGISWNREGVDPPARTRVISLEDLGVPAHDGLVLVARSEDADRDDERIRLLLETLERGVAAGRDDPRSAARVLAGADTSLDADELEDQIEATLPALGPEGDEPLGTMDPARWRDLAGWMRDAGLIEADPDIEATFTNALLPGSGL